LIAHPASLQEASLLAAKLQEGGDTRPLYHIVYEALRFKPMLPLTVRYCQRKTIIAKGAKRGRTVPGGSSIIAAPLAAMFDPEVFSNPSKFDSGRRLEDYAHFGFGPHKCFGQYVADIVMVETIRSILVLPNLRRAFGFKGRVHYDGPVVTSLWLRFDAK
jgi:cytochrome P450